MEKTALLTHINTYLPDNNDRSITPSAVRNVLGEIVNFASRPHFNIRDYGAVGDCRGAHDCVVVAPSLNTLSSVSVSFVAGDVGKSLYISTNTTTHTITAVNDGVATFTPAVVGAITSGEAYFLVGTDDTAAIQAALDAAAALAGSNLIENSGATNGIILMGGDVYAPAGSYGLFNSSASFSGGKKSALQIPRRVKFFGAGQHATSFNLLPGSYGHMIANKDITGGTLSFADFIEIGNMTLNGYQDFNPNALNGIHLQVAADGYEKTDPFNRFHDITCTRMKQDGFHLQGRGEFIGMNLLATDCARYGIHIYDLDDYKMVNCNAGGNKKTGIRLFASGAGHLMNCKAFYSGANGGSNIADCCNWYINADQMRNGLVYFTSCEGQESRGSSWVIDNAGLCIFNGCIAADPARAGINSGTLPAVCAGFHLMGEGCRMNIFNGCLVTPSVAIFSLTDNWGLATDAVFIAGVDANGAGPQKNRGDIYTFEPSIGGGGVVDNGIIYRATYGVAGGAGTTNGRNTGLSINGIPLSKVVPLAPTITVTQPTNTQVNLTWTAGFDGGSPITDYKVEYKLTSEPTVWTTFADGTSTNLTASVTGLTNGLSYDFRVSAINAIGTGAVSATSTTTPNQFVPAQVTGLTATAYPEAVLLGWDVPFDGGAAITDYKIEYKLASEPTTWTTFSDGASTNAFAAVTGLTASTSYNFRASAINSIGTGTVSATSTVSTLAATGMPSSTVFDIDATHSLSYAGTGQAIKNIEASPADSAFPTAYNFQLGATSAATSSDPTFTGTAGNSAAYFNFDGGDILTLEALANTAFLNNLHKTTGGSDWWFAVAFRAVNNGNRAYFFSTQNGNNAHGLSLYAESNEVCVLEQGSGAAAVTSNGATLTSGTDYLMILSKSAGASTVRRWVNSRTKATGTITLGVSVTDATQLVFGDRGLSGTFKQESGFRLYGFAAGNAYLDDADVVAIFDAYNARHGRTYA